jgi:hypothetical protein
MTDTDILFVGLDPSRMNLVGAPAGTADAIQEGIDRSMRELSDAGYSARYCSLAEDDPHAEQAVRAALAERPFACVAIGAGLRLLPKYTVLFEALVAAVIEAAPHARLAFNATPGDAADAVRRQLGRGE